LNDAVLAFVKPMRQSFATFVARSFEQLQKVQRTVTILSLSGVRGLDLFFGSGAMLRCAAPLVALPSVPTKVARLCRLAENQLCKAVETILYEGEIP
jgi:hypothetical protein